MEPIDELISKVSLMKSGSTRKIPRRLRAGYDPDYRSDPSKSATTNDPFLLVKTSFIGGEARRWKDLMVFYRNKLGPKFYDENVRVRVLQLVTLTIELERSIDGHVSGTKGRLISKSGTPDKQVLVYRQGDPESLITITNAINGLLRALGLD